MDVILEKMVHIFLLFIFTHYLDIMTMTSNHLNILPNWFVATTKLRIYKTIFKIRSTGARYMLILSFGWLPSCISQKVSFVVSLHFWNLWFYHGSIPEDVVSSPNSNWESTPANSHFGDVKALTSNYTWKRSYTPGWFAMKYNRLRHYKYSKWNIMTSSNGHIFCVTGPLWGEFTGHRLNNRVSKQSWGWWFETPLHPLWRHCNEIKSFTLYKGIQFTINSFLESIPNMRFPQIWPWNGLFTMTLTYDKFNQLRYLQNLSH